jgi:hypothetical protein
MGRATREDRAPDFLQLCASSRRESPAAADEGTEASRLPSYDGPGSPVRGR